MCTYKIQKIFKKKFLSNKIIYIKNKKKRSITKSTLVQIWFDAYYYILVEHYIDSTD